MSEAQASQSDTGPGSIFFVGPRNLVDEFARSLAGRKYVERQHEPEIGLALRRAQELRPSVVVVDAADSGPAAELIRGLRRDPDVRSTGIIALSRSGDIGEHQALRNAGANYVLAPPVDPDLWDARLGALLSVPPRRDLRVPVLLEAWSTLQPGAHVEGVALNISVKGILLESEQSLEVGTKFDLSFCLPDGPGELQAVGRVVRRASNPEHARSGIEFLVLQDKARDRIERFVAASGAGSAPEHPRVLTFRQSVERREWAAELHASEVRNAAILASVLDAIVIVDAEGLVVEWNLAAESMFGCARADAVGRPLEPFLGYPLASERGAPLGHRVETSARRSDGLEFPVELAVTRLTHAGLPLLTLCLRDITERKRAERAQAAANAQFRALFERAVDAMAVADGEGRYVEVNAAACTLYGLERRELLGRWIGDLANPDFDFGRLLLPRAESGPCVELRLTRPDGSVRDIELAATPDFLPGSHLVVLRDVTEQRALESRLRQAQKMEAVGRLAGGIAHDFNNLLGVIGGYAELLLRQLPAGGAERGKAEKIGAAATQGAELTRKLLAFGRRQILEPQVLDPNELVRSFASTVAAVLGHGVEVRLDLEPRIDRVEADPRQFERVLTNLALNARDAMPRGGRIVVETRNIEFGEATTAAPGARPGPYVRLRFSDTGTGMAPEIRRRAFEPFFSTKAAGHGTGLGLATVFGIVTQSGGFVGVDSTPGQGTTFTIHLPSVPPAPGKTTTPVAQGTTARGRETILVVEDQPMLRSMLEELLKDGGYTVMSAEDGQAALRIAAGHEGKIDALVTDVVMPGLQGPDLAERLRRDRTDLKVVFCSGHTDDSRLRHGQLARDSAFLAKPFAPAELERTLRQLLDTPPAE